jgi:hypothetical protein
MGENPVSGEAHPIHLLPGDDEWSERAVESASVWNIAPPVDTM